MAQTGGGVRDPQTGKFRPRTAQDGPAPIRSAPVPPGERSPKPLGRPPKTPRLTKEAATIVPFVLDLALQIHPKTRGQHLEDVERDRLTEATLELAKSYPIVARWLMEVTKVGAAGKFGMVIGCIAVIHLAQAEIIEPAYGQTAAFALAIGWETLASSVMSQAGMGSGEQAEDTAPEAPGEAVG